MWWSAPCAFPREFRLAFSMDKYTFCEKVGEGSYAVVYRAEDKHGTSFAIKALKDDFHSCVLSSCAALPAAEDGAWPSAQV